MPASNTSKSYINSHGKHTIIVNVHLISSQGQVEKNFLFNTNEEEEISDRLVSDFINFKIKSHHSMKVLYFSWVKADE